MCSISLKKKINILGTGRNSCTFCLNSIPNSVYSSDRGFWSIRWLLYGVFLILKYELCLLVRISSPFVLLLLLFLLWGWGLLSSVSVSNGIFLVIVSVCDILFFFFLNISFSSPVGSLASGLRAPWRVVMAFRHAIWPASKKSPLRWRWGSTRPLVSGPPLQSPEFAIATWAIVPNGTPLIGEKWETSLSSLFLFCLKKIYIFPICHLWYISAINVASLVLCFVIDNWRMWIECFYLVVLSPSPSVIIKCSTSCGKGMRHRRVYCQGFDGRDVGESDCSSAEKPSSSDICDMGSCSANTWFFTEWSGQVRFWPVFLSIEKNVFDRRLGRKFNYFLMYTWSLIGCNSVRKNAELGSRHAKLTVPATAKWIAM